MNRSIDAIWDADFCSSNGIIDLGGKKQRHFMMEFNRIPYLLKTRVAFEKEELAKTIVCGHVKLQLPIVESIHENTKELISEFKITRKFGEMSNDYNKRNYNIYLFSEGRLHHDILPAYVCVRLKSAYYASWYLKGKMVKTLDETIVGGSNVKKRRWHLDQEGFGHFLIDDDFIHEFAELDRKLINGDLYDEFTS